MNAKRSRIILVVVILCLAASVGSSALFLSAESKVQVAVADDPPVSQKIVPAVVKYDSCLLALLSPAESKVHVADVPPVPQEIITDVVSYDSDLIKVTSNWPTDFTVENISDKEISGIEILIATPDEKEGVAAVVWWGTDPKNSIQTSLLKRGETISIPIPPQVVKRFQDDGAPFLYVQVSQLWVNNDPKIMYSDGAVLQQDEKKPTLYHVIIDSKGKSKFPRNSKSPHSHNHAFPHITHSVKPPFLAPCCNREYLDEITFDCEIADSCDPQQQKCQITNKAYTLCGGCGCPNRQGSAI